MLQSTIEKIDLKLLGAKIRIGDLVEDLFFEKKTEKIYLSSHAFQIASFCGTGAVISIFSLVTGCINANFLA